METMKKTDQSSLNKTTESNRGEKAPGHTESHQQHNKDPANIETPEQVTSTKSASQEVRRLIESKTLHTNASSANGFPVPPQMNTNELEAAVDAEFQANFDLSLGELPTQNKPLTTNEGLAAVGPVESPLIENTKAIQQKAGVVIETETEGGADVYNILNNIKDALLITLQDFNHYKGFLMRLLINPLFSSSDPTLNACLKAVSKESEKIELLLMQLIDIQKLCSDVGVGSTEGLYDFIAKLKPRLLEYEAQLADIDIILDEYEIDRETLPAFLQERTQKEQSLEQKLQKKETALVNKSKNYEELTRSTAQLQQETEKLEAENKALQSKADQLEEENTKLLNDNENQKRRNANEENKRIHEVFHFLIETIHLIIDVPQNLEYFANELLKILCILNGLSEEEASKSANAQRTTVSNKGMMNILKLAFIALEGEQETKAFSLCMNEMLSPWLGTSEGRTFFAHFSLTGMRIFYNHETVPNAIAEARRIVENHQDPLEILRELQRIQYPKRLQEACTPLSIHEETLLKSEGVKLFFRTAEIILQARKNINKVST